MVNPGSLVCAASRRETQVGTRNSGFRRKRFQILMSAVGLEIMAPLLAVRLAHGRGVEVAVSCAAADWCALPRAGFQLYEF